jgi:hypothetical protein
MATQHDATNAHAEHQDRRVEQAKQEHGDIADLTVGELKDVAEEEQLPHGAGVRKEQLLDELDDKPGR